VGTIIKDLLGKPVADLELARKNGLLLIHIHNKTGFELSTSMKTDEAGELHIFIFQGVEDTPAQGHS
jgi:hypothetical protein